jgi:hypothetical protein
MNKHFVCHLRHITSCREEKINVKDGSKELLDLFSLLFFTRKTIFNAIAKFIQEEFNEFSSTTKVFFLSFLAILNDKMCILHDEKSTFRPIMYEDIILVRIKVV